MAKDNKCSNIMDNIYITMADHIFQDSKRDALQKNCTFSLFKKLWQLFKNFKFFLLKNHIVKKCTFFWNM